MNGKIISGTKKYLDKLHFVISKNEKAFLVIHLSTNI